MKEFSMSGATSNCCGVPLRVNAIMAGSLQRVTLFMAPAWPRVKKTPTGARSWGNGSPARS